ncbi:MAG: nucleotidyl transferase AbiEii/AbiGii toxin family protein [Myxococcales bacterium]|nr:nucleotidyl transferase AbiEii/AbiGii toxin family protein [Myxococcales bacterium]
MQGWRAAPRSLEARRQRERGARPVIPSDFSRAAEVRTYELDELLGTKLRALYQRKQGRDLFDLGLALRREGASPDRIVEAFARHMEQDGARVTRAMFEQNLAAKRADRVFAADMTPLLATGQAWSFDAAYDLVWRALVGRLPGEPWKGT